MNSIYKIVYNKATGTYQAVAEFAKSQTKSSGVVGSVTKPTTGSNTHGLTKLSLSVLAMSIGMTLTNSAMALTVQQNSGSKGNFSSVVLGATSDTAGPQGAAIIDEGVVDSRGDTTSPSHLSVAVGGGTRITTTPFATVLGAGAKINSGQQGSVALGAYSTVGNINKEENALQIEIGGQVYQFAGKPDANSTVLSVGSGGSKPGDTVKVSALGARTQEDTYVDRGGGKLVKSGGKRWVDNTEQSSDFQYRQIQNVAAGTISDTSTDAINGSQLFAVAEAVKKLAEQGPGELDPLQFEANKDNFNTDRDKVIDRKLGQKLKIIGASNGAAGIITNTNGDKDAIEISVKLDEDGPLTVGEKGINLNIDGDTLELTGDGRNKKLRVKQRPNNQVLKVQTDNNDGVGANEVTNQLTAENPLLIKGKAGKGIETSVNDANNGVEIAVKIDDPDNNPISVGAGGLKFNFDEGDFTVEDNGGQKKLKLIPKPAQGGVDRDTYVHVNTGDGGQQPGDAETNKGKADEKGGATGTKSIAAGVNAKAQGHSSVSIGDRSTVGDRAQNSVSIGANNNIENANVFVLGSAVTKTHVNSVFLGGSSGYIANNSSAGATKVPAAMINGVSYGNNGDAFAGHTPVGVVSVGNDTQTRRIQGVGAGLITAQSTDAINGSQLYHIIDTGGWKLQANN
ncbi:ESPR-type extended signal peptide-containing protein, partial [Moraxella oculi]